MNVALASVAALAPKATAKSEAGSGGPLADFMALLDQLGLAVENDSTQSTAAKLLAKLSATTGDAADPKAKTDAAEGLTALLAKLDKDRSTKTTTPEKLDIAGLLALVGTLVARNDAPVPTTIDNTGSKGLPSPVALITPPPSSHAAPNPVTNAQNDVQAAFARLAAFVAQQQTDATPPTTAQGGDVVAPGTPESGADATHGLAELLARLTAPAKTTGNPVLPATATPLPTTQANQPPVAVISAAAAAQLAHQERIREIQQGNSIDNIGGLGGVTPTSGLLGTGGLQSGPAAPAPLDPGVSTADQLAHHHLDLARDSQWLDTLARDITRAAQHDTQLRFQLNPEHLGSLKVELVNGAHGTSVKLTADTEAARAILADAQPRLVAEARAQGLRISETQVGLGQPGGGRQQPAEPVVIVRNDTTSVGEVDQNISAGAGERYA